MEDDRRADLFEEGVDEAGTAQIPQNQVGGVEHRLSVQGQLHMVESRLVAVHHDESLGLVASYLMAQPGADGTAGTGDQDPFTCQVGGDRIDIDVDRALLQQVGQLQRAEYSGTAGDRGSGAS